LGARAELLGLFVKALRIELTKEKHNLELWWTPEIIDEFYRAKQTCASSMFLQEKNVDLVSALINLCEHNGVVIPGSMNQLMGEVESLLFRISKINSLPTQELLRLPPIQLTTANKGKIQTRIEHSQGKHEEAEGVKRRECTASSSDIVCKRP
jgi:hypothetical protein